MSKKEWLEEQIMCDGGRPPSLKCSTYNNDKKKENISNKVEIEIN